MDALAGLLPIALLLVCPAMMIFCFWGMRRMSCSTESRSVNGTDESSTRALSPTEQARLLQTRLNRLQREQSVIATQLAQLVSLESTTSSATMAGPEDGSVALEGERA